MRDALILRGSAVAIAVANLSLLSAHPSMRSGVAIHVAQKAHGTYVLFDGRDLRAHLIDMNGNEVRAWNRLGFPAEMIDPALTGGRRGHVLLHKEQTRKVNQALVEVDWNDRIVWEWGDRAPGGTANQNHDVARLANGNTLVVSRRTSRRGAAPWHLGGTGESGTGREEQCIYEVTPDGAVAWSWAPSEHIEELGFSPASVAEIRQRDILIGLNDMQPLGDNRFHRAGDVRFRPENVLIGGVAVAIIDRPTGSIVWSLARDYPGMDDRLKHVWYPTNHDAHMIPSGLPGEGNILIFDNHGSAFFPPAFTKIWQANPSSRVIEVDPVSKKVVWTYTAESSGQPLWDFHSSFISSARRLPNGNTLINEGMRGRIFQVTPSGEIVWQYVSPYEGKLDLLDDDADVRTNWVFRAQPVPYDWAPSDASVASGLSRDRVPSDRGSSR